MKRETLLTKPPLTSEKMVRISLMKRKTLPKTLLTTLRPQMPRPLLKPPSKKHRRPRLLLKRLKKNSFGLFLSVSALVLTLSGG